MIGLLELFIWWISTGFLGSFAFMWWFTSDRPVTLFDVFLMFLIAFFGFIIFAVMIMIGATFIIGEVFDGIGVLFLKLSKRLEKIVIWDRS